MPDPIPAATTASNAKVSLLGKVEAFFEKIGHIIEVDFEALEADVKAVFDKHSATPPPVTPVAPPSASSEPTDSPTPASATTPPAQS